MDFDEQKATLTKLVEVVVGLQSAAKLVPVDMTKENRFRHRTQNKSVYLFMKALRYVSLLNAAFVLIEKGFIQEVGILCRCLTETQNDFFFIAIPNLTISNERLEQHLGEFFQEEFMPKTTGLIESNKRNRVSRKNIHSSLASSSELANPHEAKLVYSTLETAYSGYVHGAYGHLMEMYGGPKFGFRANGLPNEAFRNSIERQFGDLVYIGLIILEMLSKTLDDGDTNKSLLAYRKTLEGKYPEFALSVESRLKQAKLPIKNMK